MLKKGAEERKWTKTIWFRNRWLLGPKFTVCSERNVFPSSFSCFLSFFVARFPVGENTCLLPCGSNTAQGVSGKRGPNLLALFKRRDVHPRQTMRQLRKVCHAEGVLCLSSWQQTQQLQTKLSLQDVGLVVFLNLAKAKSFLRKTWQTYRQGYKPRLYKQFLGSTPGSKSQCSMTEKRNFF